ncbi:hypothetical protein DW846_02310 [Ruminococcus sp. AM36-2AA]|jgi:hypothetical protein|nr:hypothetical protein DW851_02305 [Ruminococcus sp. AM36-5]RGH62449.1 hypothetical protein DW846_02310 [Ruminococcus sp. AM36-2AA]
MRKMLFSDLSMHVQTVFANLCEDGVTPEENYEGFKKLTYDLNHNPNEIYDEEGNKISKKEADDAVRKFVFAIMGLNEHSTKRDRKRAMDRHGIELFEVMEEEIDIKVETGFRESEFFNNYVEQRNLSRGDSQEFWTNEKVILSVTKISGDHHDFTLQRLGSGESYTVTTSVYGIAVGADIDLYLAGRYDWAKLTDQCAAAFVRKVQNDIYAEMMNAGKKLPAQFQGTGALSTTTKDKLDTLLEDVSLANDGAQVVIMGTRTGLQQFQKLMDVDWITDDQKRDVATMGRLGYYGPYTLVELPQRFALNDTTKKLLDPKTLFIMPQVEDKFIKFVDVGETEIYEVNEKGARMDDTMKYEVQRAMGVGVQIGRYFGVWTLA